MSRFSYNIRLQKRILHSIEENASLYPVRKSKELIRYEREYYREFLTPIKQSSKSSLTAAILKSDIVYCGDFHSFRQSQKTLIRILRTTIPKRKGRPICIALECIPSKYQSELELFLGGEISLSLLRENISFEQNWAFPWEHYAPLLSFAKENQLFLLALNSDKNAESLSLFERDLYSARIISQHVLSQPDQLVVALYGDLHVARKHLPKATNEILRSNGIKPRVNIIFQNEPSVYWKLAESQLVHKVEVVKLRSNTWCIVNSAPWVRLQAHFDWLEEDIDMNTEDFDEEEHFESKFVEGRNEPGIITSIPARLNLIANHILHALQIPKGPAFDIDVIPFERIQDLVQITKNPSTPFNEARTLRTSIFLGRPILLPECASAYLPTYSLSSVSEIASHLIRLRLCPEENIFINPLMEFSRLVLQSVRGFFVSKIVNPKRRCDEVPDLLMFLAQTQNRKLKIAKRFQRRSTQWSVRYIEWLEGKRKEFQVPEGENGSFPVGYDAARIVGQIIGERVYHAWTTDDFTVSNAQELMRREISNEVDAKNYILSLRTFWKKAKYHPKRKRDHL